MPPMTNMVMQRFKMAAPGPAAGALAVLRASAQWGIFSKSFSAAAAVAGGARPGRSAAMICAMTSTSPWRRPSPASTGPFRSAAMWHVALAKAAVRKRGQPLRPAAPARAAAQSAASRGFSPLSARATNVAAAVRSSKRPAATATAKVQATVSATCPLTCPQGLRRAPASV